MTGKLPSSGRYTERFCPATRDPDNFKNPVDDWDQYPQLPEAIKEMVLKCWSNRPERRPSMGSIEKGLAMVLEGRNISRDVDLWPTSEQLRVVSLPGSANTL
ncbi:hypothetical protein FRC00_001038 [Tulasnella sp. 408]|nr:hypothetical protein FRC00_001038 [Tulasnella sp. 408]